MAGITPTGWETTTVDAEVDALTTLAKSALGEDIPTTPDSRMGQFLNVIAETVKRVYDLGGAVTDTQNLSTAEGIYLEYFAEHKGTTRLQEAGSTGELIIVAPVGTSLPAYTPFDDALKRRVLTQSVLEFSRATCYSANFAPYVILPDTEYKVTINGSGFSYTSAGVTDKAQILAGLETAINAGTNTFTVTKSSEELTITNQTFTNNVSITPNPNVVVNSVGEVGTATAVDTGPLTFTKDSINTIVIKGYGILSVNNYADFEVGRYQESDYELRLRLLSLNEFSGKATSLALKTELAKVVGVTAVHYEENDKMVTDNGMPPKSYQMFVTGGLDKTIAEVIFETGPATITPYGTVNVTVKDSEGDDFNVGFSRTPVVYGWVRVTYALNSEESFPLTGEADLKAQNLAFGSAMYAGEDLEPTKFYAPSYNVKGLVVTKIEVSTTSSLSDTPVWQTTAISIPSVTELTFTDATVLVTT